MITASPRFVERPRRATMSSLVSALMPFHSGSIFGAVRSESSTWSGGSAIGEPPGWSGSSASRNAQMASLRTLKKPSCRSFVRRIDLAAPL
jgi:hypothetical protein